MVLCLVIFYQTGFAIGNFSRAVTDFINVTEAKLTRVIIDLQQNTGGTVELAFSTFKRFFPDSDPFAGSRRRTH
jgi:C-terminal processing protease CtpA/Prc